jgi:hypothetical protein
MDLRQACHLTLRPGKLLLHQGGFHPIGGDNRPDAGPYPWNRPAYQAKETQNISRVPF